ncbi:MAG: hypothetical protein RI565_03520 [Schleiferiaceae bacterium]|nr:hypothetical protein [Schleiferiaceae bacterium]
MIAGLKNTYLALSEAHPTAGHRRWMVVPKISLGVPLVTALQSLGSSGSREQLHLLDGHLVEPEEAIRLSKAFFNPHGIKVFQVGQAYQLTYVGVIADIAFLLEVGFPPLFSVCL